MTGRALRERLRRLRAAPAALATLTAVTLLVGPVLTAGWAAADASAERREVVRREADESATAISQLMERYTDILLATATWVRTEGWPSQRHFDAFMTSLGIQSRIGGVQSTFLARYVRRADLPGYARMMDGDPSLPQFTPRPALTGDDALLVSMLSPLPDNGAAYGFDMFSEANRRTAAENARDTGRPQMTAPIRLVMDPERQRATDIMVPLFRPGMPIFSQAQRRAAFYGVAVAALRTGDVLHAALGVNAEHITVYDEGPLAKATTVPSNDRRLYPADRATPGDEMDPTSEHRVQVDVVSRTWLLFYRPPSAGATARIAIFGSLFGGLIIAVTVGALVYVISASGRRVNQLAQRMTVELRTVTETANDAIITINEHRQITAWNNAAELMLGKPERAVLGSTIDQVLPDVVPARDDHEGGPFERIVHRPSGDALVVEGTAQRWSVPHGTFRTAILRDVTARRAIEAEAWRLEQEHAELARRFELLVESAATGMCGISVEGVITFVNQRAAEMLGYGVQDLIGIPAHATIHHHRADGTPYPVEECPTCDVVRTGVGRRIDTEVFWRRDGSSFSVEYAVEPLQRDGRMQGVVLTFTDITERRLAEQALQDAAAAERLAAERLREVDKVRSDLISTVSHELRTPLTSMAGYLEMILDGDAGDVSDDIRSMIEPAQDSCSRLMMLVENLLTASSLDAKAFRLASEPVSIDQVLHAVTAAITPLAVSSGLTLDADIEPGITVWGDHVQLERAVLNLLSNAVKFTPRGGSITLIAARSGNRLMIQIRDTGIGIPKDEQSRLFARFFRSSEAVRHVVQGTGLGLSIVKEIVDHHGGTVRAESALGEGTVMMIELPMVVDSPVGVS